MRRAYRLVATLGSAALAVTALVAPIGVNAASEPGVTFVNGFKNFQIGALPNEVCPNTTTTCQNGAAEPQIRSDKAGTFYGVSENSFLLGTEAWKSTDGGLHYAHLPSPNKLMGSPLSSAGGDVDLSTATVKNSSGNYNVYVASLEVANTDVSMSPDGGQTWIENKFSGKFPGQDREWIAADGQQKVCISYVTAAGLVLSQAGLHVECSYDAGATFTQVSDAINPLNLDSRFGIKIGNLMIDENSNVSDPNRRNDIVYQTFVSQTVQDQLNPNPTGNHIVWMAVSRDGGRTFSNYQVYNNPDVTADYGHQFPNVSVDRGGNVYSFFSDNHNLYFKFSTDHGRTWHGNADGTPIRVNSGASKTAIFPWSVGGDPGKVDVVWYGTDYWAPGGTEAYPYPSTRWYVYFGQNLNATTVGSSFSQVQASPVIHLGGVCQGGVGCTGNQTTNRDLFDDFGVAVRQSGPMTGFASIIYSDDQSDQYKAGCAPNNDQPCDHTSIATQTTGTSIITGGGGGGSGCREGDGSGNIQGQQGGSASFQSDEDGCKDGDQNGEQMTDAGAKEEFHSTQVKSVQYDDTTGTMTVTGLGVANGLPVTFVIVEQAATSMTPALYTIQLSDGYMNTGNLLNGAVTLN